MMQCYLWDSIASGGRANSSTPSCRIALGSVDLYRPPAESVSQTVSHRLSSQAALIRHSLTSMESLRTISGVISWSPRQSWHRSRHVPSMGALSQSRDQRSVPCGLLHHPALQIYPPAASPFRSSAALGTEATSRRLVIARLAREQAIARRTVQRATA